MENGRVRRGRVFDDGGGFYTVLSEELGVGVGDLESV
jgi:hypothetical protein